MAEASVFRSVNLIFLPLIVAFQQLPEDSNLLQHNYINMSIPTPSHLRALYRSILRELPSRPLSHPSPLQKRIRTSFSTTTSSTSSSLTNPSATNTQQTPVQEIERRTAQAKEYIAYVRAQRMYATLLERYNPGMSMDEEERVRLTARRVGMELPEEYTR